MLHHFQVIIDKSDHAKCKRKEQNRPDPVVSGDEPHARQNDGDEDHDPAHGRRSGLFQVRFHAVGSLGLAHFEFAEFRYDHRSL